MSFFKKLALTGLFVAVNATHLYGEVPEENVVDEMINEQGLLSGESIQDAI